MILSVDSISKHYDGILALDNVSFTLEKGDIFGLLGRNGGGKTTLIKIITSNISDYNGSVNMLNCDIRDRRNAIFLKENIAYLPDKDYLYTNMTPLGLAKFFTDFFRDFSTNKAMDIFTRLDVNHNQKLSTMSKGQAEKVGIALTLARNTSLYIFDEPLAGADVISRDEIFFMIREYCANGAAIIATHLISSVESIVNKALFLNKKTMAYGSKDGLLQGFNSLEDSFRYYAGSSEIKQQPNALLQDGNGSHNKVGFSQVSQLDQPLQESNQAQALHQSSSLKGGETTEAIHNNQSSPSNNHEELIHNNKSESAKLDNQN